MANGRHFGAEFARLAKSTAPNYDEPASPVPNRRGDKVASGGRLNVHKLLLAVTPSGSPPAAPSSIAFPNVWKNSVDVTFKDNSNNENGFLVFVSTDNKAYKLVTKLPANTTKIRINGLKAGTRHWIQIVSFGARGNSTALTGSFTTKA